MNSFQDFTVFNSFNPDTLAPKARKPLPFPLEDIDNDVSDAYTKLDRILIKLQAAESNPVNDTPAKKKRLKGLAYKAKSCMQLIKELSLQCQELWF